MKEYFKTSEVSKMFDVTNVAVIDWIRKGLLPAYETGGGHYRILGSDLVKFAGKQNRPFPKELVSEKYRILIADDDLDMVKAIKAVLANLGVDIEIEDAYNGFEAGIKTTQFRPHLVILDVIMPGADGSKVCEIIKKNEQLKDTKILVFTGYPLEGEKLLKLGADKVIEKTGPESSPDIFRREVCKLLDVKYTKVIINK
jgi:CheY-like chemotaxis protein